MKNETEKEKPKGLMKRIWNKTDGWKTIVGVVLHVGWLAVHLPIKSIDWDTALTIHGGIGTLTGVGIGDKARKYIKSEAGKKVFGIIAKVLKIK